MSSSHHDKSIKKWFLNTVNDLSWNLGFLLELVSGFSLELLIEFLNMFHEYLVEVFYALLPRILIEIYLEILPKFLLRFHLKFLRGLHPDFFSAFLFKFLFFFPGMPSGISPGVHPKLSPKIFQASSQADDIILGVSLIPSGIPPDRKSPWCSLFFFSFGFSGISRRIAFRFPTIGLDKNLLKFPNETRRWPKRNPKKILSGSVKSPVWTI